MTRPAGVIAIAGLIAAGGFTSASPAVCVSAWLCVLPGRDFQVRQSFGTSALDDSNTPARRHVSTPQSSPTREDLDHAIDRLGAFDYDERMEAARFVRRAPGTVALPALLDAAAGHADGFVRYRALVLMSGYDDPRVPDQMEQALGEVNDRLRLVAFSYFERHPDPRLIPLFLKALDREVAEFVRPALIRTLAVHASDARVRAALLKEMARGPEAFRDSLLEALGDYKATYALKAILGLATLNSAVSDDAVLAVGKIGDKSTAGVLEDVQRAAPAHAQPAVATAMCLLGNDCASRREFLVKSLASTEREPGSQDLFRAAATGLGALAVNGDVEAGRALVEIGVPATDPIRTPVAVALAGLATKQPATVVSVLESRQDREQALELLREGFDGLEDDFKDEQFFVALRTAYYAEPDGSTRRSVLQAVINRLEF